MSRKTVLLLLALCIAGTSGPANAAALTLSADDAEAVRQVHDAYFDGQVAGDRDAVMALFAKDAVIMPHHGDEPKRGKEAISAHFFPPGLVSFEVLEFAPSLHDLRGDAKLAHAHGRFALRFRFETNDEVRTLANEDNYLMVFEKVDGEWRIARYIWNDPVPRDDAG